jgi:hypothetical protein
VQTAGGTDQFSVTPALDVVYDSNVLRLNDIRSGSAPRDDVRITPALAFDIRQRFARNSVTISGDVGYDFYQRFKGLERLRTNVSAGGNIPFGGRCTINPGADLQIQQADLEDLGVAVGRTVRILSGEVIARCPRSAGFYPVASANVLRLTNSGPSLGLSRSNWSTTGGVVYSKPSLGQVQLFLNTGQFRRRDSLGLRRESGQNFASVGVQYDRAITSHFATRISVAAVKTDSSRFGGNRFNGLNYSMNMRVAFFPALVFSPSVSRQVVASINTGTDYVLSRQAGIGMNWSLTARSGLVAGISRSRRRYFGEDPLVRNELRIADVSDSVSIGYRYLIRSLRLQIGVSHRKRDSKNNFYDFTSTRAEFSARAGF